MKFVLRTIISLAVGAATYYIGSFIAPEAEPEALLIVSLLLGLAFLLCGTGKQKDGKKQAPAPKKKSHVWMWVVGILICLCTSPLLAGLVGILLGLVFVIVRLFGLRSARMRDPDLLIAQARSTLAEIDQLEKEQRREQQALAENRRREQRQHEELCAQAKKLDRQASYWERQAEKTGRRIDERKAEYFRSQAREARKKTY